MQSEILENLALEKNIPCVSISMNTHRTHPDNEQDGIILKNLLKEAKERVTTEFGKRQVNDLLEKLDILEKEIDINHNLDSLHIFLSNLTKEIIKLPLPVSRNTVQIAENFAINPLVKALNRTEEYLILLLSQSGVFLFHAVNDRTLYEIKNEDFPFSENPYYVSNPEKLSDAKQLDNMVREFLNGVDKAAVKVHNETGMNCVVICTEDNYSRLMQIADKPALYYGYSPINYNDTTPHNIVKSAWKIVSELQAQKRKDFIDEIQEAMGQGKTLTDLSDIYRAAKEGKGDILVIQSDFSQAVKLTGEYSFEFENNTAIADAIDIANEIVREVISKKGRIIFTNREENNSFGDIVLKVRY